MPAVAFTTITPFQEILFGKHFKTFIRKVIVTFFQGYDLFHAKNLVQPLTKLQVFMLISHCRFTRRSFWQVCPDGNRYHPFLWVIRRDLGLICKKTPYFYPKDKSTHGHYQQILFLQELRGSVALAIHHSQDPGAKQGQGADQSRTHPPSAAGRIVYSALLPVVPAGMVAENHLVPQFVPGVPEPQF